MGLPRDSVGPRRTSFATFAHMATSRHPTGRGVIMATWEECMRKEMPNVLVLAIAHDAMHP